MKIYKNGAYFVTGALALLSASQALAGTCHLSGTWRLVQDNNFTVTVNMRENGDSLSGTASTRGMGGISNISGEKTGYSSFEFTVNWANGAVGEYRGDVKRNKFARGTTNGVGWHSLDTFRCD
jgi:hypothetical protein